MAGANFHSYSGDRIQIPLELYYPPLRSRTVRLLLVWKESSLFVISLSFFDWSERIEYIKQKIRSIGSGYHPLGQP